MNKEYETVIEILGSREADFFEGSVKEVIKKLEGLHEEFPGYVDFTFEIQARSYDPDSFHIYDFFGGRQETDEERDERLVEAKKARASQRKRREKKQRKKRKEN